jgi:heme/copper-type cytochrome/quinol oxidase subunit 2
MSARHGILGVAIVAAVLVALSFAGVGSDLATGIFWNIDGLLLLSVCLLMVLVFGAMLFFLFKTPKVKEAAAAAKPAAPAAPINRVAATPTPAVTAANSAEQGQPAKVEKTAVANPSQTAPQK